MFMHQRNAEDSLAKKGQRIPSTKCCTPLSSDYRPAELKTSAELKSKGIQAYQELIGVLHWAVKLGRVDTLLEALLMSTYMTP